MIRFLIDAQLPPALAQQLARRGFPSEHVNRVGFGIATDTEIWSYAARTGATLMTKDEDFATLAKSSRSGPQVVWVRLGSIANPALWRAIEPTLQEIVESLQAGDRIVEVV
jgi:predicted nuclease of predicted toxin-antitoxin system